MHYTNNYTYIVNNTICAKKSIQRKEYSQNVCKGVD